MLGRRRGLLRMAGRTAVVAGTATAVSGRVSRRSAQRAAENQLPQDTQDTSAAAPAIQPTATSFDDHIAQIKALGELKDNGLLTDDEFAAEKAKVLAL